MKHLVLDPFDLPFRFMLGNDEYKGMPRGCKRETNGNKIRYTAAINNIEVRAECVAYDDFDASEWTVYLTNKGDNPTETIRFLYAVDTVFCGENPIVYTCNGDYNSPDGYSIAETKLAVGAWIRQLPYGGRPCDRAFPYHRIQFDGHGHNIAIGWPGKWEAEFKATDDGIRYVAGQEQNYGDSCAFETCILPGETIRTPLIVVVSYQGGIEHGINVWRRWFIKYVGTAQPMTMATYKPANTVEYTQITEESQLYGIRRSKELGINHDVWWIDAGWYNCKNPDGADDWWASVGDWEPDCDRFPRGLAPIGLECEKQGMKFLLWFEPERVVPSSKVVSEHPEWILTHDWYDGLKLLDISQNGCCDYLIKKIGDLIEEYHVKIFRQDYNIDEPIRLWRNNDSEDRRGATENLTVQAYLRFWDGLLERFPDLIIDSCASGGRRNDIETLRRSVVMHHTDSSGGNHPVQQSFYQTLYTWIPYFRGFSVSWEKEDGEYGVSADPKMNNRFDEYNILHSFAPMTSGFSKVLQGEYTEEEISKTREYLALYRRVAPILCTGDFYALTPYHKSRKKWTAWQFDVPEENCGVVEIIRNNAAEEEILTVIPHLDDEKYLFRNMLTGEEKMYAGGEIFFAQPMRSVTFWEYMKIKEN